MRARASTDFRLHATAIGGLCLTRPRQGPIVSARQSAPNERIDHGNKHCNLRGLPFGRVVRGVGALSWKSPPVPLGAAAPVPFGAAVPAPFGGVASGLSPRHGRVRAAVGAKVFPRPRRSRQSVERSVGPRSSPGEAPSGLSKRAPEYPSAPVAAGMTSRMPRWVLPRARRGALLQVESCHFTR